MKTATTNKTRKCTKGYSCGNSCISRKRTCRSNLSGDGQKLIEDYKTFVARISAGSTNVPAPETPATSQPPTVNQARLEESEAKIRATLGEERYLALQNKIARIIDDTDVSIRIPTSETLQDIISEGRMKTSVEAFEEARAEQDRKWEEFQASGNTIDDLTGDEITREEFDSEDDEYASLLDYNDSRLGSEEFVLGLPRDTPPQERPVYAYLGDKGNDFNIKSHQGAKQYGDLVVKLKSDVRDRATISGSDSWEGLPASSARDIKLASFISTEIGVDIRDKAAEIEEAEPDINDLLRSNGRIFTEMQIQRGVSASDIAEVNFTAGQQVTPEIQQWADENGVTINVLS